MVTQTRARDSVMAAVRLAETFPVWVGLTLSTYPYLTRLHNARMARECRHSRAQIVARIRIPIFSGESEASTARGVLPLPSDTVGPLNEHVGRFEL